jgi:glycine/D-amino acid oxidase-like deaminating enzyme
MDEKQGTMTRVTAEDIERIEDRTDFARLDAMTDEDIAHGRPPAFTHQQAAEARQRRADGATLKELAESYNVGMATISRVSKRS